MPKTSCSCADDSEKQYTNNAPKFFTFNHFDNKFVPSFQNPSRILRDMVRNGAPVSLIDRSNCLTCDDTVSTQDKLKVRKKDRPKPYRVPYNHYRKVSSCNTSDCLPNLKINKDTSCNEIQNCEPVNYAIYRQVDKFGIRNLNNGGNYKNYLQTKGKNYEQNTFGILPECAVQGKDNTYKIGSVENLVYNKNSNSQYSENCQLGYEIRSSRQEKKYSIIAMNTTTRKYSNPYHNTSGSVSSRQHINKKIFKGILAGQGKGKDGYNNCINGQLCTLYMAPGPNTKLISARNINQRCLPPRLRGLKQKCFYLTDAEKNAITAEALRCKPEQKFINPQFERYNYITGQSPGYLRFTFNHCKLSTTDKVEFTFTGSSATSTTIFTSNSAFINASSSVTLVHTDKNGVNTTLTVADFFVNNNNLFFYYPLDVTEGTTQITIDDGNNNVHLNNTNGAVGRIFANVIIPLHNTITSSIAWDVSTICSGRNGSIVYNDNTATNDWITTDSSYTNEATVGTIPPEDGYRFFGPYIRIKFKVIGENLKSGDVLKIEFYTTYNSGFFDGITGINTFQLNGYGYNNPVLFIAENTTNPSNSDIISNAISSASWNGAKSSISVGSFTNTWYLQTLNINIDTTLTANDPTDDNDYYIINLESTKIQGTGSDSDYYSDFIFSQNPSSAATLRYELSCNCFNQNVNNSSASASLKQAKAWEYNAPDSVLSFISWLPTNFYAAYESNNTANNNNSKHQIPTMSWFSYQDKAYTWDSTFNGEIGSAGSGYISDPKWINTSGDLVDISNVNQNRFHKIRFYQNNGIPAGSEIKFTFWKQVNNQPGGGISGYFEDFDPPPSYNYVPNGAEQPSSTDNSSYQPIPVSSTYGGTYNDFWKFELSGPMNHYPGNRNEWNIMDLRSVSVSSDGTLGSDFTEHDINKYIQSVSTHMSSFGGENPSRQILTITTGSTIDSNRVVELILHDNALAGYSAVPITTTNRSPEDMYSTGNIWHNLQYGSGPSVDIAARPMGLFENGPTSVDLYNWQGTYDIFGGEHFNECERDGHRVGYGIDISNNGSSQVSIGTTGGGETAFYWKDITVVNKYSTFPKEPSTTTGSSGLTTTEPSYFIKTLPNLSSLPSSYDPTTIRFYHRTSIPKDSLVQIIFSTENFQRSIDGWGTNGNSVSGTSFKEGDFFGKGFFNTAYTPPGTGTVTGISQMTEGTPNNVLNWDGNWSTASNVGADKFGIRILNKVVGNSGSSNIPIKNIRFKRLEEVGRNTYDNTYSSWTYGYKLSRGPFIQDLMQFKIDKSITDTNGNNYFDIQMVDGIDAHDGSNHTQNNTFQNWLAARKNLGSPSDTLYTGLINQFYITIMIREPINDDVIASIVRHKIDMS